MKKVNGEKLLEIITPRRKGNKKPFEMGVGYETDDRGCPTGCVRIRTEQIESGVAPVVASLTVDEASRLIAGLTSALKAIGK